MRKIFSFVLMATALLISGMASAVDVTTEKELRDAIAEGGTIVLQNDIQLDTALQIYGGQTIVLDLNGHTLKNNDAAVIYLIQLFKGNLTIENGTVKGTTAYAEQKEAIRVYGTCDETQADWSTLTIAANAKVINDNFSAICVYEFTNTYQYYAKAPLANVGDTAKGEYPGIKDIKSNPVKTSKDSKNNVPDAVNWTSTYYLYVQKTETDAYATVGSAIHKAQGVKLNIYGYVYGKKYGIKVNGKLRDSQGETRPKVFVASTAEVCCEANTTDDKAKDATALYCAGVADYTVNGYVHGNIAVAVKAGDVKLENATIVATGEGFEEVTAGGSGMNGGSGCGIIVDTQKGYGGNQTVTISGDTKVTGKSGYAIQEVIVSGDETAAEAITIEGGTIEGGEKGAMNITESAKDSNIVTVYGATVEGKTTIADGEEEALEELTSEETFVTETVVDGKAVIVVSKGEKPAATEYSINATYIPESVILQAETVTLDASKKLGFVQMTNATVVTIGKDKVLEIGQLLMGDDAQIIIEPGAKLIVSGEQGLVAGKATNLVIKADATGMGTFIFNPAVTSNRTPKATVEYYLAGAADLGNGQYNFEIVANPFNKITAISHDAEGSGKGLNYQHVENGAWKTIKKAGIISSLKPFEALAITTNATSPVTVSFQGELQGNISGNFILNKGFNYIGNAYVAKMNAAQIISALNESEENVQAVVYTWDIASQNYKVYTEDNIDRMNNLSGMAMFVLYSNENVNVNLDYKKLVWDLNK